MYFKLRAFITILQIHRIRHITFLQFSPAKRKKHFRIKCGEKYLMRK